MLNLRAAILLDHPEDKLSLEVKDLVLAEIGKAFRETLTGVHPLLQSYRLDRVLFYACADQWFMSWLVKAINRFQVTEREAESS